MPTPESSSERPDIGALRSIEKLLESVDYSQANIGFEWKNGLWHPIPLVTPGKLFNAYAVYRENVAVYLARTIPYMPNFDRQYQETQTYLLHEAIGRANDINTAIKYRTPQATSRIQYSLEGVYKNFEDAFYNFAGLEDAPRLFKAADFVLSDQTSAEFATFLDLVESK